jgi:hypothetical protein
MRSEATLLETYSEKASRGFDYFTPEDRHHAYKKLRLAVLVHPVGISRSRACSRTWNVCQRHRYIQEYREERA